jgi:t-SNARE complex subunit (syntaxin)
MPITAEQKDELERDILLLKESMEILNEMITEQGTLIDNIEEDTCDVKEDVQEVVETLQVADQYSWLNIYAVGTSSLIGIIAAIILL